jgi:hypothetical protein
MTIVKTFTDMATPVEIHQKVTTVLFQANPDVIDRDDLVWRAAEYSRFWAVGNVEGCESVEQQIDYFIAKYFPNATKGKK